MVRYKKKPRVYRDPFPLQVRRRLSYAFRTTITPPTTSTGGFSIAQQTFLLNSCYDPDKSVANTGLTGLALKSSRINHQPMGFDQLMTLYRKYIFRTKTLMKDSNVNFRFAVNPFKFAKAKNSITWADYKGITNLPITINGSVSDLVNSQA